MQMQKQQGIKKILSCICVAAVFGHCIDSSSSFCK